MIGKLDEWLSEGGEVVDDTDQREESGGVMYVALVSDYTSRLTFTLSTIGRFAKPAPAARLYHAFDSHQ